ncbi:MAG: glycosyltransferase family 87 protein [Syntrophomonadaceae bacterium]|nr:glycosyltransferase family 87 protein [Syntrophomonadaceae bacterium]
MRAKYVLLTVLLIVIAGFSIWCSQYTASTDFASFYRAAKIALNSQQPISDIYRIDDQDITKYSIPANEHFVEYRYSVLTTYLISPLALLNYDAANAAMIFINIVCYALAVILILKNRGAQGRWFLYPLAIAFLWMPFIQNIRWGQINAILLLLITLAVLQADKNRYFVAGVLLALATLFKPFVLAVALVLFLKDWRVAIGYIGVIFAALLLPGTSEWLHSFFWPPHPYFCYSAAYRCFSSWGYAYFWIWAVAIGLITAYITLLNRRRDYLAVTALALPAVLATTPVLEVNHPTILIFVFASLINQKLSKLSITLVIISWFLTYAGSSTLEGGAMLYAGIFTLWIAMLMVLTGNQKEADRDVS